ncbi:putative oxidoreductase SadH [compost metagenome]
MSKLENLKGKVAVVTGGASGIGRGIAEQLIAEGMTVVIADIEEATLQATASEIGAVGIRTDVSDYESVEALVRVTVERFGTVHVLCNNAGVGPMGAIAELSISDWRWIINVNLWGVIHGVQAFLPILKSNADGGHIVNTSSMSGLATTPELGSYCVTKFGVNALSEVLSQELEGTNVGVSVLCPGPVRTNIGKSSRNRPDELNDGKLHDVMLEETEHFGNVQIPWLTPEYTGKQVVHAIKEGELFIFPHPELFGFISERHALIDAAVQKALDWKVKNPA